MKFQWDYRKAAENTRKHGASFDEAVTVFRDPWAFVFDDEAHSVKEHREIIIGYSILNRLVLVCFTEREEDVVRIFSARRTTKREQKDYEENAKHSTP